MKSWFKKTALGLISLLSILGINVSSSIASVHTNNIQIKENTPLYLEHGSTILDQSQEKTNILAWHYSHSSHGSHGSHYSHESHYSHYSSRY